MRLFLPIAILSAVLLSACGPGPKPDSMQGEDQAAAVVSTFLTALQNNDRDKAKALTHKKPDFIIKDFDRCREYFFERQPTGKKVLDRGIESYGSEWQIFVDMQLNYGPQMKQLHFILGPGKIPKVRGVTPIVPID